MKYIDHAGTANTWRIINPGVLVSEVISQLLRSLVGDVEHLFLCSELQTTGRAGFNTSRLKAMLHTIRTERTLEDLLRLRIELRHIERAPNRAVLATNAFVVIEINDPVFVLDDGALCWTGRQTSWIGAMHAALFSQEPLQCSVFALDLVHLD